MKKLVFLLVLALLLVPTVASADPAITYNTGFQVQNLSDSTANIDIYYYNQVDGTQPTGSPWSDTINPNSSKTYYPIHPDGTFNGSVVVSSDQQVVAIANLLASGDLTAGASTNSFSAGATMVNLPLIMREHSGYNTWFNVQNAGTADASITVTYYPGTVTDVATIKPGASATFDQATKTELGTDFVGSAVVTSAQPVVATVIEVGSTIPTLLGYSGFTAGSTTVNMPLVQANNAGYFTGIQIQNTGTTTTTVTVTYSPNTVGSETPTPESADIGPGQSHTFLQGGGQWTYRYVGSATATGSPAEPLVAIVNQLKSDALCFGSSYEGFDPAAATTKVSAPLIMANNAGYFTGIQVQNAGTTTTTVTVTYSPNTVGSETPTPESADIGPGQSHTFLQGGGQWTYRYIGSAVITATENIVAVVNELNSASNDALLTYNGFNY